MHLGIGMRRSISQPESRRRSYDELRRHRVAARRLQAIRILNEAQGIAGLAGGTLIVFGSLAEGRFDETSDIDVVLTGVAPDSDTAVAAQIDTILGTAGFEAEVIPERFAPPSLKRRIERYGREVTALG